MAFWNPFRKKTDDDRYGEIISRLNTLGSRLDKIENRQKETMLQIDDIDNFLQEDNNQDGLPEALMALIEIIYDFYLYAGQDSALYEQAQMMLNKAKKSAESVGLEVVGGKGEVFDFRLCTVQGTDDAPDLPDGCITQVLQCGFIFKDEILRRAVVVVNKKTGNDEK